VALISSWRISYNGTIQGTNVAARKVVLAWLVAASAATAQMTLNLSEDLVRLGIASGNMVPNDPTVDAGPLFFPAVLYAKNHKIGRVIADRGAYYFQSLQYLVSTSTQYNGAHVAWDSLSNMTIDLQGSDLYFSKPLVGGMVISNSTNLVLENFTADYDPLPFTQVRVTSVDAVHRQIQFAVDGNWQNPSALNPVFALPPNNFQAVEVHIFRNGRPVPGVPRMNAVNPVGSTQFTIAPDPTSYATSAVIGQIRPGDIAFLGMRYGGGPLAVLHCTGCTFRNIKAYSGPDIAFNISFAQSSVLEHLYSIPRPGTDRLVSNYGGIFLADPLPNNQIRLNRMIRTMDNSLEYDNTVIGSVTSQTDSRTFVLAGSLTSLLSYGLGVPNASAVDFQRVSDGAIVASAVTASPVAGPYSGNQATFTFDRDLPASIVGTVMIGTDPSLRAANAVIERNAVEEETDCCGGLFVGGGANSVLRGNYVHRSAMSGVQIANDLRPGGFNSPPAANFAITNNVIDGANYTRTGYPTLQLGSIAVYGEDAPNLLTASPHQNISVTGNFISDSGSAAVWLGNTTNGTVTGNYFLNPNSNVAVESAVSFFGPANQPLVVQSSQNSTTGTNIVDQSSNRMWVTNAQYSELAAYAPGSTIRLNAYGLGAFVPAPNVSLTDADGNTTPLTIQPATAHAIDVQLPASAGLGGAYLTLTSGGVKYFGTLFLDAVDNVPALNGCTYELSPSSKSMGSAAGTLPILVITQDGCTYQVLDADTFVAPGSQGVGTGVMNVGFAVNTGVDRITTIEIAGQTFAVKQMSQSNTPPSSIKLLPQFVFGGGWYSALYFSTTGSGTASFPVSFIGNDGNPLNAPSLGGSTAIVNLAARGTAIIEAPNVGDLKEGYVSVMLPPGVTGYAVFRQSVTGRSDQEAVVPLSDSSATATTLIWDDTALVTTVAVVGLSSTRSTVSITARDPSGAVIGNGAIALPPNGKVAAVLHDVPGLGGIVGKRGSADFSIGSGAVAVLGIRFGGAAFTDIPTASLSGQSASATPATMILPQLAFGGGWYTAMYFANSGTSSVSFPVNFIGNDGNPLSVPALGGSSTTVNLPPHGITILEAPNTGTLTQGYASAALPAGVTGYAVFRQTVAGRPDQEAVVPLSGASSSTSTLIWDDTAFVTAVAIAGLSPTVSTVVVTARDAGGNVVGTGTVLLPPNGKVAMPLRDVSGLSGIAGLRGSADFSINSGHVALLGIRFGGTAFTDISATDQ
jgi:hypothetical protein